MKILILSPTEPIPAINGTRIRIYNFIKYLSVGNFLTLINLSHDHKKYGYEKERLNKYCRKIIEVPHFITKKKALLKWLISDKPYRHVKMFNQNIKGVIENEIAINNYDIIFCNFLDMGQYLIGLNKQSSMKIILDQHNADEIWFGSFAHSNSMFLRYFGKANIKRLRKNNDKYYEPFDLVISVSKKDADYTIKSLKSVPRVSVIPNGVDIDYFKAKPSKKEGNIILFCGSMDSTMNQNAVIEFYNKILPKIRNVITDVHFMIVGRNPPDRIIRMRKKIGVTVTGTVNDVRIFYNKAKVVVAPFKLGGGTKLKIIEAMAMKVPVVSTSIGAQGLLAENETHLMICDDENKFADVVIKLLNHPPIDMINQARRLVENEYSWEKIVGDAKSEIVKIRKNVLCQ